MNGKKAKLIRRMLSHSDKDIQLTPVKHTRRVKEITDVKGDIIGTYETISMAYKDGFRRELKLMKKVYQIAKTHGMHHKFEAMFA